MHAHLRSDPHRAYTMYERPPSVPAACFWCQLSLRARRLAFGVFSWRSESPSEQECSVGWVMWCTLVEHYVAVVRLAESVGARRQVCLVFLFYFTFYLIFFLPLSLRTHLRLTRRHPNIQHDMLVSPSGCLPSRPLGRRKCLLSPCTSTSTRGPRGTTFPSTSPTRTRPFPRAFLGVTRLPARETLVCRKDIMRGLRGGAEHRSSLDLVWRYHFFPIFSSTDVVCSLWILGSTEKPHNALATPPYARR
jgi:hypothetical protein